MNERDKVLLLGDRRLRATCEAITDFTDPVYRSEIDRLKAALEAFRASHGFGRGIAAPQIGIAKRFIALNLGEATRVIVNPRITWMSPETFSMWDDCMSFPDLLVLLTRRRSISLDFQDESGAMRSWEGLGQAEAELLQHEIDHLDGILALDRAIDRESVIYRCAFESDPAYFKARADYSITATI